MISKGIIIHKTDWLVENCVQSKETKNFQIQKKDLKSAKLNLNLCEVLRFNHVNRWPLLIKTIEYEDCQNCDSDAKLLVLMLVKIKKIKALVLNMLHGVPNR